MKLTSKTRYAVTAMVDVALQSQQQPISLQAIAERQQISHAYLEQLFVRLRRAKLVVSQRGPGGGYTLARRPSDISVADVMEAVSESVEATKCKGAGNCRADGGNCLTHNLWASLETTVNGFFSQVSLQQLIDDHQACVNSAQRIDSQRIGLSR